MPDARDYKHKPHKCFFLFFLKMKLELGKAGINFALFTVHSPLPLHTPYLLSFFNVGGTQQVHDRDRGCRGHP